MKEQTALLLDKAQRAIHAAETLRAAGDTDFAIGRAHYAMFYAAEALLNERGLHFRKHGGVHAAFGGHLVKKGQFDAKYHRWLLDAFDKRILGDYAVGAALSSEDAESTIDHARQFLAEAQRHLNA